MNFYIRLKVSLYESKDAYETNAEISEARMQIQSNVITPQNVDADHVPWNINNKLDYWRNTEINLDLENE